MLRRAARRADGKYRVLVSRFADGKPLGNFRYYGTRPDDPNDIVPHEHRRELRAARVFGAWLNHDDSRGVNSLDMLVGEPNRRYIKHYMFDFGSIMGSGTVYAQRHRPGNEYILEWKPGWLTLATLGMYARPWTRISYPDVPRAVGRFEADAFEPTSWKPEYPNPAFENMRPEDAFWAARIISRFDDATVRAVVEKARYSDPRATEYMTATLLRRRDKVLRAWLTPINPLVDFSLSASGELTFANAAEQAGVATPPRGYRLQWARFDNLTGLATDAGSEIAVGEPRAQAPAALTVPRANADFIQVRVAAIHPHFPSWATPVTVYFRREGLRLGRSLASNVCRTAIRREARAPAAGRTESEGLRPSDSPTPSLPPSPRLRRASASMGGFPQSGLSAGALAKADGARLWRAYSESMH